VLVSVLGFFLAQIDFIPIVGEWASQLAEQIAREVGQGGFTGADRPGPPDTDGTAPDN
jgi:hypothetical protein